MLRRLSQVMLLDRTWPAAEEVWKVLLYSNAGLTNRYSILIRLSEAKLL
jgi:hypothetical protein